MNEIDYEQPDAIENSIGVQADREELKTTEIKIDELEGESLAAWWEAVEGLEGLFEHQKREMKRDRISKMRVSRKSVARRV